MKTKDLAFYINHMVLIIIGDQNKPQITISASKFNLKHDYRNFKQTLGKIAFHYGEELGTDFNVYAEILPERMIHKEEITE